MLKLHNKKHLFTPVKVEDYSDFRPGTKKPKLREDPVWLVNIKLPIELIKELMDIWKLKVKI